MTTIKRSNTIEVDVVEAPSTPLNLRFGVVYAPRTSTKAGQFAGYGVLEVAPGVYELGGFEATGRVVSLFRGDLAPAWHRLCVNLGMVAEG